MRPIRFRGRDVETNKIVYGYLVIHESPGYTHWIYTDGAEPNSPVDPKSIEQLINLDKNSAKVYENDKVVRVGGEDFNPEKAFPFAATFSDYDAILNGEIILVTD